MRTPDPGRVSIFGPWMEKFNLWIGVAFLPWVIYDSYAHPMMSQNSRFYANFLASFVFLNWIHNTFSYLVLFAFPETRNWRRSRNTPKSRFSKGQKINLVLGACLLICFLVRWNVRMDATLKLFAMACIVFITQTHIVGQLRGLSSLYNHQMRSLETLPSDRQARRRRHISAEKWLFQVFAILCALPYLLMHFGHSHFKPFHQLSGSGSVIICTGLIIAAAIFLNSLLTPEPRSSNKSLFLARTFYVPLMAVSYPALLVSRSLHGIEYLGVLLNMKRRSKWAVSASVGSMIIFGAIAGTVLLRLPMMFHFDFLSRRSWLILLSLNFFLEITHYYLDGILFQFHQPEVRQHIGPLMTPRYEVSDQGLCPGDPLHGIAA